MKKLITAMVTCVLVLTMVLSLVACAPKPRDDIEAAIMDASKMSLAELEAKAKAEFEAAGTKFVAKSPTSGVKKVLQAFEKKYTWFSWDGWQDKLKDADMYKAIDQTVAKGNFWADFALLQAGANYRAQALAGNVYNYAPKNADDLALKSNSPFVALTTEKNFVYNKAVMASVMGESWKLENVWQLTGDDGANGKKGVPNGISFQDPLGELSNFSFLAQATSKTSCKALEKAYKNYYGTAYKKQDGCENIGYYFVKRLIANVTTKHKSDTTAIGTTTFQDTKGTVFYGCFNKMKNVVDGHVWQTELWISGVDAHLDGFDGFTYSFYTAIPKTTKLPYTACLFARYIATEEGFKAGWKDVGYYSANTKVSLNEADGKKYGPNENSLQEDEAYVLSVFDDFETFISPLWAANKAETK